jgi:hypothetical protein
MPEMVKLRQALMDKIKRMNLPPAPLDHLIGEPLLHRSYGRDAPLMNALGVVLFQTSSAAPSMWPR